MKEKLLDLTPAFEDELHSKNVPCNIGDLVID